MITEETYLEMKDLIAKYEAKQLNEDSEQPYLKLMTIETEIIYNPKFGDNKLCKCGHVYYRHFDSYEEMFAIGCKYCSCDNFEEV